MSTIDKVRNKTRAKKNEECDIIKIVKLINEKCPKILNAFESVFIKYKILNAIASGASRRDHHDFKITVEEIDTKFQYLWTVEHKGTQKKATPNSPPWKGGVQFYNGGMEKFKIAEEYSKSWYAMFIASECLRGEFNIPNDILTPDYDTWRNKDAKTQGNPKTPFGVALKKSVRGEFGPKSSLIEHRNKFVPSFIKLVETDTKIMDTLKDEILEISKKTFEQKDAWLEINGNIDIDSEFTIKWSKKLTISKITSISFDEETKSDFTGKVESDLGYPIKFIIRWGKGAGFSNLRVDLK